MAKQYDLVVIGPGTAAQVASNRVRAAGWSVAVIDTRPFGGTCALRGCDPKKMLVSGAETVDLVSRMRGRGVEGDVRIDWADLIAFGQPAGRQQAPARLSRRAERRLHGAAHRQRRPGRRGGS
jgi:glutathione reductase (NADPH)